jgi:peroxiredoxin
VHVQLHLVSDKNGSFIRMMGLELGDEASKGPKCQRFAGIVEDGILMKVVSGGGGRHKAC